MVWVTACAWKCGTKSRWVMIRIPTSSSQRRRSAAAAPRTTPSELKRRFWVTIHRWKALYVAPDDPSKPHSEKAESRLLCEGACWHVEPLFGQRADSPVEVGDDPVEVESKNEVLTPRTSSVVTTARRPRTEIYATTDGTSFKVVGHLPVGLRYPAVSTSGGTIVIAGGLSADGPTTVVYAFDPTTGAMRRVGALPAAVAHAASFSLMGTTYVAGGRNGSDAAVSRVTSIDPATGIVTHESPLPHAIADAAVASSPGRALLIGGWGRTTLSQVLRATTSPITSTSSS